MKDQNEVPAVKRNESHAQTALAGLVIGSLAGAGAMLLLAPTSGKQLRTELAGRTIELRDRALETAEGSAALTQAKTRELTDRLRGKASELNLQGKHLLARQLQRVAAAAAAGGKAIEDS